MPDPELAQPDFRVFPNSFMIDQFSKSEFDAVDFDPKVSVRVVEAVHGNREIEAFELACFHDLSRLLRGLRRRSELHDACRLELRLPPLPACSFVFPALLTVKCRKGRGLPIGAGGMLAMGACMAAMALHDWLAGREGI